MMAIHIKGLRRDFPCQWTVADSTKMLPLSGAEKHIGWVQTYESCSVVASVFNVSATTIKRRPNSKEQSVIVTACNQPRQQSQHPVTAHGEENHHLRYLTFTGFARDIGTEYPEPLMASLWHYFDSALSSTMTGTYLTWWVHVWISDVSVVQMTNCVQPALWWPCYTHTVDKLCGCSVMMQNVYIGLTEIPRWDPEVSRPTHCRTAVMIITTTH